MPKILLGVCGGIAAYKSCELVREFRRAGCEVRVVMTEAAERFVTKLTFEALTGAPVSTGMWDEDARGISHIEVARWADLFVIAPTTADTIAKMAEGRASDLLSVIHLAFRGRIVIAPAMNTAMWDHPAVQKNVGILRERGVEIIPPVPGELACGEVGVGKMAEPMTIVSAVLGTTPETAFILAGKRVVVTAGATREYLDPVRFLSSPSTGTMGFAIAREAARRGADVTVVHGPTSEKTDFRARFVPVTSAQEMFDRVSELGPAEIFLATAAVADYRPIRQAEQKLKKENKPISIELTPTPDILASVSAKRRPGDLIVGFAAETENVERNGRKKLETKNLDLVVANEVGKESKGFGSGPTTVYFLSRSGTDLAVDVTKDDVARRLLDRLERFSKEPRR
ncbi:MAG: bifunctional phosphopantothenoylcysteine decarboxylase/phosphopantothenate--cysteine ligase CoaBC [Pseudomonadota bacterium]